MWGRRTTIHLDEASLTSTVVVADYHGASIAIARERAESAGAVAHVDFEVATASGYGGSDYDLVTMVNCFHEMGDSVGVATHLRETFAEAGAWMIDEPFADDRIEANPTSFDHLVNSISTVAGMPNALSQDVGSSLWAQAGEERIRTVVTEGGFTRFHKAAETPTSPVFEATP